MARVDRRTVDLSAYPDLIVIYLGLRVNALTGIKKALGLGPQIAKSVADKPDGLLLHEDLLFSLFPPHLGMRQYWRDFESMERWTRSTPHRQWWKDFLRESGGTGFWHETYSIRGGIEAIYDDMPTPVGLMKFAPLSTARGSVFSARQRLARAGCESSPAPTPEADLYRE
jgi:fumigallin biosynthesis monooxygenase-like protein